MKFKETDNTLYCVFTGKLDYEVCAEIEHPLRARVNDFVQKQTQAQLVFDLGTVEYVSSAFLRLCLVHCKLVGRTGFTVVCPCENVGRVFRISGFTDMMCIVETI